jgi:hypothetical protein
MQGRLQRNKKRRTVADIPVRISRQRVTWRKPSNQPLTDVYLVISSFLVANSQSKHVVHEPFRNSIRLAKSLPGRLLQFAKLAM